MRAGGQVFALDAAVVERIVALDQVDGAVVRPGASPTRVQVGGRWYAVRPLAELFGGQGPVAALVLIELEAGVRIAVGVAACLRLAATPSVTPVPAALVRIGGAGLVGAFPGAAVGTAVGLAVDLTKALGAAARAAVRAELASAALDDWGPT